VLRALPDALDALLPRSVVDVLRNLQPGISGGDAETAHRNSRHFDQPGNNGDDEALSGSLRVKMQLSAQILTVPWTYHLRKNIPGYMTLIRHDRTHNCKVATPDEKDRFRGDAF
jgi:hypothetical protein